MEDFDTPVLSREQPLEADDICKAACDYMLSGWDEQFINDMTNNLGKYGRETLISSSQWEQLRRIKEQYA